MGYYIDQEEVHFFIAKKDHVKALEAIHNLAGKETISDSGGRHFSWVNTDCFLSAKTLTDALEVWRWTAEEDAEGNITYLYFEGQKLGDDLILFEAIAPYVKEGSYICMRGEDGEHWRWFFENDMCVEQTGKVVYDSDFWR